MDDRTVRGLFDAYLGLQMNYILATQNMALESAISLNCPTENMHMFCMYLLDDGIAYVKSFWIDIVTPTDA